MSPRALRLARSYLFVPGDHDRLLGKVFDAGADAVVLDLEDAVASERKAEARRLTGAALAARGRAPGPLVYVRINAVGTGLWLDDLDAVTSAALDGLRLPKVESRDDLEQVSAALDRLERERGVAPGSIEMFATIESAAGVLYAAEIARAPRMRGFTFGATDFLRDIGGTAGDDGAATLHARSHLVLVSRAARLLPPVSSVYTNLADLEGLRRTSEADRRLGFFGRSCVHPAQVPIVHEVFSPTSAEIAQARAVIDAFQQAAARGAGASRLPDGQFVDRAVVERAHALVALAAALGPPANAGESRP
jgi:citrate lyase subunit beta/citryl-CoA lyase